MEEAKAKPTPRKCATCHRTAEGGAWCPRCSALVPQFYRDQMTRHYVRGHGAKQPPAFIRAFNAANRRVKDQLKLREARIPAAAGERAS